MAQFICNNLTLGYESKIIIQGLSFEVDRGDYLCIVGENGTGKTTLMKTMLGLHSPISGSISLGEGISQSDIGYLPQQTVVQKDFPASVKEIVLSGCLGRKKHSTFYSKEDKELADVNIKKMGIEKYAKRCYRELSGGQQQRVLLARALCATSKILFLDEPVSGLDPQATVEMYETIKQLNREEGITTIMISHDIDMAIKFSTHVLHLGKMFFHGTRNEYLDKFNIDFEEVRADE